MNHEVTWEWFEGTKDSSDFPTYYDHHVGTCSCGTDIGKHRSNENKQLAKSTKRAAWTHTHVNTHDDAIDAPMQLVGNIIKQRVTNEVWIMSAYGEMPEYYQEAVGDNAYNDQEWAQSRPWCLVTKNSNGWRKWVRGRYTYREQAYALGLDILEEARVDGHQIEIASKIDLDTIEIPIGGVYKYLEKLVDEVNTTDKPETLIELQGRIVKARSMLELLEGAQRAVELKLVGLNPKDDPRYTEYEYTP